MTSRIGVTVSEQDVVFNETFYGYSPRFHPDAALLVRYLALVLGSKLVTWLALVTSGEFGFEREVVEKVVLDRIPIPDFDQLSQTRRREIVSLFDRLNTGNVSWVDVDDWIVRLYGLGPRDLRVILDTLEFNLPFAVNRRKAQEIGAGGARWGVWGVGDVSGFAADVEGFAQEATVLSGFLGIDYRFVPNALAGLAASYSDLDLTSTSEGEGDATIKGALVSVYPYGLWMPEEWLGVWSLAGVGMGTLELIDVGGGMNGDIRTWLGAVGQRAELWSVGALSVAAKSDGFVTGVTAGGGLPGVSAHAWRARVLLEAGVELRARDARFGGLVELGGRLDGGDADRGLGAEAGAELSYRHTGIGWA